MADQYNFSKVQVNFAHLPTLMLMVGYVLYWVELYVFHRTTGQTTCLSLVIFLVFVLMTVYKKLPYLKKTWHEFTFQWEQISAGERKYYWAGGCIAGLIALCVIYASFLPVHLVQEFDSLQYHITLPRQHLILNSFKHIPWAADDLFLLPIDFGLAPYWLVTTIPNKIPQFIFLVGLFMVSCHLADHFSKNNLRQKILIIFALLGSHHVGIQMGTAMLDLVICYLFLAALDSYLKGYRVLFLIELTFFFWSKSLIPIQMTLIFLTVYILIKILKVTNRLKDKDMNGDGNDAIGHPGKMDPKGLLPGFLIFTIIIAGPFLAKSLFYSGTVLFPFGTGTLIINPAIDKTSEHWQSLQDAANIFLTEVKDRYGHGRGLGAFFKHFWLIAVPENGVNNSYDYPLGLVYLLVLGPFISRFINSMILRKIRITDLFIIVFWLSWWLGSQQSRFLYIPVILMVTSVISSMEKPSWIFMGAIFFALCLNTISLLRCHKNDWGHPAEEVLRQKDRELLQMSKEYLREGRKDMVDLNFHDVAFAQFPVRVTSAQLPHTLSL